MLRPRALLLLVVTCCVVAGLTSNSWAAEPAKGKKMLRHVVLYKFKDQATAAEVQKVIDTFSALPSQVDTIAGFERGANVSEEGKSQGYTHAFVVTFRDQQGLATYLKHPAHDAYVKVVTPVREKVLVFDYWTSE